MVATTSSPFFKHATGSLHDTAGASMKRQLGEGSSTAASSSAGTSSDNGGGGGGGGSSSGSSSVSTSCPHELVFGNGWTPSESPGWVVKLQLPEEHHVDFEDLWAKRPQTADTIRVHNYVGPIPRRQIIVGRAYQFNKGLAQKEPAAVADIPGLQGLIEWANGDWHSWDAAARENNWRLDGAIVNFYKEAEYIGWHSDDERMLRKHAPIYSFNFLKGEGEVRVLNFRKGSSGSTVASIEQKDGDVLIMGGNLQETHQHSAPKVTRKGGKKPQVNITLRAFLPEGQAPRKKTKR